MPQAATFDGNAVFRLGAGSQRVAERLIMSEGETLVACNHNGSPILLQELRLIIFRLSDLVKGKPMKVRAIHNHTRIWNLD